MKNLVFQIFLFTFFVTTQASGMTDGRDIIEMAFKGQRQHKGVGFDRFDDIEFVRHTFYGMKKEKITGKGVNVAIIGTGVNHHAPYLLNNIIPKSSISFFNEYFINSGLSELYKSSHMDFSGSGTHAAGIVKSIASEVTIIPVRVEKRPGQSALSSLIGAVKYAIDREAKIINLSLKNLDSRDEVRKFWKRMKKDKLLGNDNVLFVLSSYMMASHDSSSGSEMYSLMPPKTLNPNNVISVCSTDKFGNIYNPYFFSYKKADVCALGKDVYSLSLDGYQLEKRSGAETAAPFVSALSALIIQIKSDLKSSQVKSIILDKAIKSKDFEEYAHSGGYISIDNTLDSILK